MPDLGLHSHEGAARARARLKIVQQANEWGIVLDGRRAIDRHGQVQARKDKIVNGLTRAIEYLFKKNRIDVDQGTARLLGDGKVAVTGERGAGAAGEGDRRRDRLAPRGVPGIEIDRRRIITSDEAIQPEARCRNRWWFSAAAPWAWSSRSIFRRFGTRSPSSSCCRAWCPSRTRRCRRSCRSRSGSRASPCIRAPG